MTDPATLLNLADRCEQAAGPDRELDGAAWCAVNGYSFVKWDGAGVVWRKADGGIRHYPASRVPYYTASLDAAVTLVPKGCGYQIISGFDEDGLTHASVYVPAIDNGERGDSATAALALCAAALRARAAGYE